jgi:hypothetical protein
MIKNLKRRASIGREIKTGGHKKGPKGKYPTSYDHFKISVTGGLKDDLGNIIPDPEMLELFGPSPTSLPVRVMSDDLESIFSSRYAKYGKEGLECSGDGETATKANGDATSCPCPFLGNACKPSIVFYFRLNAPGYTDGTLDVFKSHGAQTVEAIQGSLINLKEAYGFLKGLPLRLTMRTKKGPKSRYPVADVVAAYPRECMLQEVKKLTANPKEYEQMDPPVETPEDEVAVAEEFYDQGKAARDERIKAAIGRSLTQKKK